MRDQKIPLMQLCPVLREHGVDLSYSQAWRAVASGTIPARHIKGRWFVDPQDVPQIVATFAPANQ